MSGIWRFDPATPEGKYPIVLRRDGSVVKRRNFVLVLDDPGAGPALRAYADAHEQNGSDPAFVQGARLLAVEAERLVEADKARQGGPISNPDAPPDREDDPVVLAWARSVGSPGS